MVFFVFDFGFKHLPFTLEHKPVRNSRSGVGVTWKNNILEFVKYLIILVSLILESDFLQYVFKKSVNLSPHRFLFGTHVG